MSDPQAPEPSAVMPLKLMADYDCSPIWYDGPDVSGNVDPTSLSISSDLLNALWAWQKRFDDSLNRGDPASTVMADQPAFEDQGRVLAGRLQAELSSSATVRYWRDEPGAAQSRVNRHKALVGHETEVAWIEVLLCESDPLKLIALGAPSDEYRPEAETIALRRPQASSQGDVQRIVYEEFVRWFGSEIAGRPAKYAHVADALWVRWRDSAGG